MVRLLGVFHPEGGDKSLGRVSFTCELPAGSTEVTHDYKKKGTEEWKSGKLGRVTVPMGASVLLESSGRILNGSNGPWLACDFQLPRDTKDEIVKLALEALKDKAKPEAKNAPASRAAVKGAAVAAFVLASVISLLAGSSAVAAPPAGYPASVSIGVTGSSGLDAEYLMPWDDDFGGYFSLFEVGAASGSGSLTTAGDGVISLDLGGFFFDGTFTDGAFVFGSMSGAEDGFVGASASSVPEPAAGFTFFLVSHLIYARWR